MAVPYAVYIHNMYRLGSILGSPCLWQLLNPLFGVLGASVFRSGGLRHGLGAGTSKRPQAYTGDSLGPTLGGGNLSVLLILPGNQVPRQNTIEQ